jgi:hypothetical protein
MQRTTSLREKLDDAAGWVMAGCGLAAVMVLTALMTSIDNALGAGLLFVGVMAGGFLATAAHELGHAGAAMLVGWRVWIISVLGLVLRRGHGLRLSTKYSHDVGGYVLASPPDPAHDSKWRSIIYTAGGPLVSVLTGPLFLLWLISEPRQAWQQTPLGAGLFAAILAFGIASSSAALWTIWPSRGRGGRPNDMAMILDALFRRDPSADVRGVAWAWGLFENGVEPEAWPRWMHDSIARSANNPWASPAASLLVFFCALDKSDEAAARKAARSGHHIGKLMRAFAHAYFDADAKAAEAEIANAEIDPADESLVLLRDFVHAKIHALNGDTQSAARAFAYIAADLRGGVQRPFWDRLLARGGAIVTDRAATSVAPQRG